MNTLKQIRVFHDINHDILELLFVRQYHKNSQLMSPRLTIEEFMFIIDNSNILIMSKDYCAKNPLRFCPLSFFDKYSLPDYTRKKYMKDISRNVNITKEFLEKNITWEWDWDYLSYSNAIDNDFVLHHHDIKFNHSAFKENRNIQYYKAYEPIIIRGFNIKYVSEEYIRKHSNRNYDFALLSLNRNLSKEFIEENIDKDWDFNELSFHPSITSELVDKYINKPWNMKEFLKTSDECFIKKHYNMDEIPMSYISCNPNISEQFIIDTKDKEWDGANILFYNKNIKPIYHSIKIATEENKTVYLITFSLREEVFFDVNIKYLNTQTEMFIKVESNTN